MNFFGTGGATLNCPSEEITIYRDTYSLVLLDLMIPKISGITVMQHIRKNSVVPIIIVSAKDTESDKTLGLGLGADDYITKPFSLVEMLARIKAAIRRTTQYDNAADTAPVIVSVGELTMNLSDYTVTKKGHFQCDPLRRRRSLFGNILKNR